MRWMQAGGHATLRARPIIIQNNNQAGRSTHVPQSI